VEADRFEPRETLRCIMMCFTRRDGEHRVERRDRRVRPRADLDPAIVDYVAHGPFAATATKPDAGGPVGAEGLAAVRRLSALPLVAIGGIDAGNAGLAIGAGADGVAVVSAIVAAADPRAASRRLRAAVEAARPHQRRERA